MTEHCKRCVDTAETLSTDAIHKALESLEDWSYDSERNVIKRDFQFKGFCKTMGFVNAVAWIAQVEKHHPDVSFGYNHATIAYQTHEAGGITENDLICARKVNALLT